MARDEVEGDMCNLDKYIAAIRRQVDRLLVLLELCKLENCLSEMAEAVAFASNKARKENVEKRRAAK